MKLHRILVVSRNGKAYRLTRRFASEVLVADDPNEAAEITNTIGPDLVLFDDHFSIEHVRDFLSKIGNDSSEISVAVLGNQNQAQNFIDSGGIEYIQAEHLEEFITQIADQSENDSTSSQAESFFLNDLAKSVSLAGRSLAIQETLKIIAIVGPSRCNPVLIVGETGTGKDLAAKAIHQIRCPKQQFVAINCAALTANLLESELFGHVKGSFTGAEREKTGLMELAGAGTVFLDEISEMPLNLQAKLLRVLQEKSFRKVGGTKTITCKATIIASSNRNLLQEVEQKRFRRDLYYRLSVCPITMAPLRLNKRKPDIRLLTEYFLATSDICPDKKNKIKSLTPLAIEALEAHDWPGNVRELRNVIERAILFEETDRIGLSSIIFDTNHHEQQATGRINRVQEFSLAKAEHELIARALRETSWQKTKAASLLGITRATLYAKVKQYSIEKDVPGQSPPVGTQLPAAEPVAVG